MPGFWIIKDKDTDADFAFGPNNNIVSIKIIKHVKRNTAKNPCNDDPKYNFNFCLKETVRADVGCSSPWNSDEVLVNCTTIAQFSKYEKIYEKIALMNPRDVATLFPCPFPCRYLQYQQVDKYDGTDWDGSVAWVSLYLASTELRVETEIGTSLDYNACLHCS